MQFFVYILQSEQDGSFYKGYTQNIELRLKQHNDGESRHTSGKLPWKLVYLRRLDSKREALIEEKRIKRLNSIALGKLIGGQVNELNR